MRNYKQELSYRLPMTVQFYIRFGGSDYPLCPRCRISLERDYMAFCDRCGQKLNWAKYPNIKRIAPNR